ncbi:hypothetical protein ACQP00_00065 [Dactylosporangium sp. CS-047395]|uniref:hypothetical protein n=1 Tax=Dactylosporangium sp. CS-047395 TaxID=3239936 RepID=UPI003D8F3537
MRGVRLSKELNGVSRVPKWIPTDEQVLRMFDATPPRYRAALWLGAGEGLRVGEAHGVEEGKRCFGFEDEELHVVQQLRYSPKEYGGFYLSKPKSGSSGTVDLDPVVAEHVQQHMRDFPPVEVPLIDITSGEQASRTALLLFTTSAREPVHRPDVGAGVRQVASGGRLAGQ